MTYFPDDPRGETTGQRIVWGCIMFVIWFVLPALLIVGATR